MDMDEYRRDLTLTLGGTYGVAMLCTAAFGIWSCVRVHRHADNARYAFTWLKALFALAFLVYAFNFASLMVYAAKSTRTPSDSTSYNNFLERMDRLEYGFLSAGAFFMAFVECLLFITLSEVGIGFSYALYEKPRPVHKKIRYAVLATCVPIIVLAIVETGWGGSLKKEYFDMVYATGQNVDEGAFKSVVNSINKVADMDIAALMIRAITMIALVVQSWMVCREYWGVHPIDDVMMMYFATTCLGLARELWLLIESCLINLGGVTKLITPEAHVGTDMILNVVILFVMMLFVFVIGRRKGNGLWTTLQPWMDDASSISKV